MQNKKQYDTLVLNKLYIPIHIITWKRALSLLYQDHAHSLDKDFIPYDYKNWLELSRTLDGEYKLVNTVSYRVAVPDILTLTRYDRLPKRDVKFSRENVFARDNFICQYCGKKFKKKDLTVDHIIPKCFGGKGTWDNIVTACNKCNSRKDNKTPEQVGMKLIHQPKEPRWFSPLYKLSQKPNMRPGWEKFLKAVGY